MGWWPSWRSGTPHEVVKGLKECSKTVFGGWNFFDFRGVQVFIDLVKNWTSLFAKL